MDQNDDINQIPQDLRDFLSSLINEAGITVDEQTHNQVIKELYVQLDNYILSTIVEELPSDNLEEFTQMAEEGKGREELEKYLSDHIPNSQEVFARALIDFKDLYLGNVAVARSAPTENTTDESTSAPDSEQKQDLEPDSNTN